MPGPKTGYLTIQNWRFGLDARRSELTSQPGTLLRAIDCHINQGAEIEKRKAFVKTAMPAGVFLGLPGLGTQFAFGSIAAPMMPAGFTYQQLTSPLGSAMSALVGATLFNNEPFVVATFGADGTFCFFNGVLVSDFTSGLVLKTLISNANQAANLIALVNSTVNYTAAPGVGAGTVIISGINGSSFSGVSTVTTADSGVVTASQVNQPVQGITGTQAVGSVQIIAGNAGTGATLANIVGVYALLNENAAVALTSGNVAWDTNAAQTAADVAANINAYQGTNGGYTAIASQNGTITIYAPAGIVANTTGLLIETEQSSNNDGVIITNGCIFTFSITGTQVMTVTKLEDSTSAVAFAGSIASSAYTSVQSFLLAIAHAVNIGGSGYYATAVNNSLYIGGIEDYTNLSGPFPAGLTMTLTFAQTTGVPTVSGELLINVVAAPSYVAFPVTAFQGKGTITNGTTGNVTAIPKNGVSPYTYSWTLLNSLFPISIEDPTSASTNFYTQQLTISFPPTSEARGIQFYADQIQVGMAVCTVTDNNGNIGIVKVPLLAVVGNIDGSFLPA